MLSDTGLCAFFASGGNFYNGIGTRLPQSKEGDGLNMIKYCGLVLCALAAMLVLRGAGSPFAGFVGITASVILLVAAASAFAPIFEFADEIVSGTSFGGYISSVMKALGIALAVQFASEICRDSGENAMASKLELIGKAEILLLCIPPIRDLLGLVSEMVTG